ncbi:thionin-like protein 2 [Telopea speciosissima]|uniref:thionin-like protein 2 n=1 Tax=Telopea speciosissima TaxID=54955 RepID=UPI001CC64071|nr:thionin-like protein 2 [Telopea speciosissima]
MERRNNVKAVVVMMIMMVELGLLATQSSASFSSCYGPCFIFCVLKPNETVCTCTLQCLKDCLIPSSSSSSSSSSMPSSIENISSSSPLSTDQYCNLGCAIFSCASLSTKKNPGVKEVGSCVSNCSQICTEKH